MYSHFANGDPLKFVVLTSRLKYTVDHQLGQLLSADADKVRTLLHISTLCMACWFFHPLCVCVCVCVGGWVGECVCVCVCVCVWVGV